jgi:hypothetical protein
MNWQINLLCESRLPIFKDEVYVRPVCIRAQAH